MNNLLADRRRYLSPIVAQMLPPGPTFFMHAVAPDVPREEQP